MLPFISKRGKGLATRERGGNFSHGISQGLKLSRRGEGLGEKARQKREILTMRAVRQGRGLQTRVVDVVAIVILLKTTQYYDTKSENMLLGFGRTNITGAVKGGGG